MVNVVNNGFLIGQFDQIFDDQDNVFFCQHPDIHGCIQVQFFVDPVSSDFTKVIPFVGKEKFFKNTSCRFFIRRQGIPQLEINIFDSFFFRVCRILLEGVENDRIVGQGGIILMKKDSFNTCVDDLLDVFAFQNGFPFDDHIVTFDGNHLTGILIHKIFKPGTDNPCSQFSAEDSFQSCFTDLHFFSEVKYFQDIAVGFITDGTQQSGYRHFLFTVDVSIHHIVDIGRELHPRSSERDDPGRIKLGSVGVSVLSEKYTR